MSCKSHFHATIRVILVYLNHLIHLLFNSLKSPRFELTFATKSLLGPEVNLQRKEVKNMSEIIKKALTDKSSRSSDAMIKVAVGESSAAYWS